MPRATRFRPHPAPPTGKTLFGRPPTSLSVWRSGSPSAWAFFPPSPQNGSHAGAVHRTGYRGRPKPPRPDLPSRTTTAVASSGCRGATSHLIAIRIRNHDGRGARVVLDPVALRVAEAPQRADGSGVDARGRRRAVQVPRRDFDRSEGQDPRWPRFGVKSSRRRPMWAPGCCRRSRFRRFRRSVSWKRSPRRRSSATITTTSSDRVLAGG
jgi:hypothetical protein